MARDFSYEVKKDIGVIGEHGRDTIRFRLISYGGREAKYDLRSWYETDSGDEGMGKGVTLTREELETLRDFINDELES